MDFIKRHRRKLVYVAGAAVSGYALFQYAKTKLVELQERILRERVASDNLERRFEQNQRDATFTIMALLPTLSSQIMQYFDVESVKNRLQALKSESKPLDSSLSTMAQSASLEDESKDQLWDQIKLKSLARAITLLYADALLVLLTRVQLNLLGRSTYIESVKELSEGVSDPETARVMDNVNRQYLTFSWWLLNRGWRSLAEVVARAVKEATKTMNARSEVGFSDITRLFEEVRNSVEKESFLGCLLPPSELASYVLSQAPSSVEPPLEVGAELDSLLSETREIIESENGTKVLRELVDAGSARFMQALQMQFPESVTRVRLASVLATASRQSHQMGVGHPLSNEYVNAMVNLPNLDGLCAVIYASF